MEKNEVQKELSDQQIEDVRLILRDLLKVIKVVALYPENNPLPQSLRRTFSERLVDLLQSYGGIKITVDKDKLYYFSETIFKDSSKEDNLAGLFFEVGITQFTLGTAMDIDDIYRLLDVFKEYQNSYSTSRDLVTCLWKAGINHFTFKTIEDVSLAAYDGDFRSQVSMSSGIAENNNGYVQSGGTSNYSGIFEDAVLDDGTEPLDNVAEIIGSDVNSGENQVGNSLTDNLNFHQPATEQRADENPFADINSGSDVSQLKLSEAADAMGFNNLPRPAMPLNTNLILNDEFKLSEEEEKTVEHLIIDDAEFSIYESISELLKELLHQENEISSFNETVTICEKTITEMVASGKLTHSADVLTYFTELEKQIRNDKPLWAERLKQAKIALGSRERLSVLSKALNENEQIGSLELRKYLDNFGWESLMGITDLLGIVKHKHHRETITDYLTLQGKNNMEIVARVVFDKEPEAVISAINILARIGDNDALAHLSKVTHHNNNEVRLALVSVLKECPNDKCLKMLKSLASDKQSNIRSQAVASIVSRRGEPAFNTISEIISDESFSQLEKDDQSLILNAYSSLGGDAAVDYLLRMIKKVNLLRSSNLAFYRQAAFEALAHNRGELAERNLLIMSRSLRPDIKLQAISTIKRRRELIFGDYDD